MKFDVDKLKCKADEKKKVDACAAPFVLKMQEVQGYMLLFNLQLDKKSGNDMVQLCREAQACFVKVPCLSMVQEAKDGVKFCEAGAFWFNEYFDCAKKLGEKKPVCQRTAAESLLKAATSVNSEYDTCDALVVSTKCMKRETLNHCTTKDWEGLKKHLHILAPLLDKDCGDEIKSIL